MFTTPRLEVTRKCRVTMQSTWWHLLALTIGLAAVVSQTILLKHTKNNLFFAAYIPSLCGWLSSYIWGRLPSKKNLGLVCCGLTFISAGTYLFLSVLSINSTKNNDRLVLLFFMPVVTANMLVAYKAGHSQMKATSRAVRYI